MSALTQTMAGPKMGDTCQSSECRYAVVAGGPCVPHCGTFDGPLEQRLAVVVALCDHAEHERTVSRVVWVDRNADLDMERLEVACGPAEVALDVDPAS